MNILLTRNAINIIGGAERYTAQLATLLNKHGHPVTFLTCIKKLHLELTEKNVKVMRAPWIRNGFSFKALMVLLLGLPLWTLYYLHIIKKHKIDIINAHSRDDQIMLTLTKWLHKKKVIWTDHGDMKHLIPLANKKKYVGWLYLKCIAHADAILCVAESEKTHLSNLLKTGGIKAPKLMTIPNGISLRDYHCSDAKQNIDNHHVQLGIVCNLFLAKGVDKLLQIVADLTPNLPNLRCMVIGDGPDMHRLKAIAQKLGITKRVCFTGYQKNVSDYITNMDIFVLPTDYEGAPLSILEAMYFKKPVVAYAVGGIPEQIIHNETGILVPHGDYEGLKNAIYKLCADSKLRKHMGMRAHERVVSTFNAERILKNIYIPILNKFVMLRQCDS